MALTETQIDMLMEIAGITYRTDYDFFAQFLTPAREAALVDDIATWTAIRDKHLKVKGGPDGVDLDNERKRAAIVRRCRRRLEMPDSGGGARIIRA